VTDDVSASLGLDSTKGALISGVVKGGPVENGPIQAGDIILNFDGKPVNEMRDLPRVVAESPVGKEVDVIIVRDGKQQTVKVTLGRLDDAASATEETTPEEQTDGDTGNDMTQQDDGSPMVDDQMTDGNDAPQNVLGMQLVKLTDELRTARGIASSVEGVLVESVTDGSVAGEKGVKSGDIIVEVGQDFMEVPGDVMVRVNGLKSEGRKNAHMMIADGQGNLRFVALPLE
jgi:serine protease Do